VVNDQPHQNEYIADRRRSCLFATLKGDKLIDVIPDDHLGQVFLLLSHLDIDYDLLAHRKVFKDFSLESSKQMRP